MLALIDAATGILPKQLNWATYGGVLMGLLMASVWLGAQILLFAALGSAVATGTFFLVWRMSNLGFGDVRLAALIGLTSGSLGIMACWAALLLGALFGVGIGIVRKLRHKAGGYPFGPALVLGCLCSPLINTVLG